MKKILTMLFLSLLVSSVFAVDWVKYRTLGNEETGTMDVFFDLDSTEPLNINNESIRYFLFLQEIYEGVAVELLKNNEVDEDMDWLWLLWDKAVEHNCYSIFIEYGDARLNMYIHNNDTATVYYYLITENEEE